MIPMEVLDGQRIVTYKEEATLLNANNSIPSVIMQKPKRSVKLRYLLNSVSSYPQERVKEAGKLL